MYPLCLKSKTLTEQIFLQFFLVSFNISIVLSSLPSFAKISSIVNIFWLTNQCSTFFKVSGSLLNIYFYGIISVILIIVNILSF